MLHPTEHDQIMPAPIPKKNYNYPDTTSGSRLAKKVRAEANKLSDAQREALLRQGMQVIYGGTGNKEAVGVRQ